MDQSGLFSVRVHYSTPQLCLHEWTERSHQATRWQSWLKEQPRCQKLPKQQAVPELSSVMQRRRASNGVDRALQSNMSLKGIKLVNLALVFISSCEEERRCLIWYSSSCCEQNISACQKWDKFHLKRRKLVFKKTTHQTASLVAAFY